MKNILISALDEKSGKTVVAYAIAALSGKKVAYMKPIGNNVLYREKKVVDQDALLFSELMEGVSPERICMGMQHSKILHFYENALDEFMRRYRELSKGKELFIVEGGEFIWKGAAIGLDVFTLSEAINADVIFVISGDRYEMLDEVHYIERLRNALNVKGVILNRVEGGRVEEVKEKAMEMGIEFLGFLPYIRKLEIMKVSYVADKIFGRVVAGRDGLDRDVENIFIAALSASEIKRHPDFRKENKLIITGGDRSDVIAACLEEGTSAIVLTNNIIPSPPLISRANEMAIPLISVRADTYTTARMVEEIKPVIMPGEKEKLKEIEEAGKHLIMEDILA